MPKRKHEMDDFENARYHGNKVLISDEICSSSLQNKGFASKDDTVDFRAKVFENLQEIKAIEENCLMNSKPENDLTDFDGLDVYLNPDGLEQDSTDLLNSNSVDALDFFGNDVSNNINQNISSFKSETKIEDTKPKTPSINANNNASVSLNGCTDNSLQQVQNDNIANLANMTNSLGEQQQQLAQHQLSQQQFMIKKQNHMMMNQQRNVHSHFQSDSNPPFRHLPITFNFPSEWLNRAADDFKAGIPRGLIDFHLLQPETQHFLSRTYPFNTPNFRHNFDSIVFCLRDNLRQHGLPVSDLNPQLDKHLRWKTVLMRAVNGQPPSQLTRQLLQKRHENLQSLKRIGQKLHIKQGEPFSPQAGFMENPQQYNNKLQCSSSNTQANTNKGNVSKNDRMNFNNYEGNELFNSNQCVPNSKSEPVFNNVITIDDENKNNANTPNNNDNFNMMSEGLKLKLSNSNKRKRIDDEFYIKNNSIANNDNKMQLVNNDAMKNEGITRMKVEGNSTEANPPFDNTNMYIDNNANMKLFPVPSPRPFQASAHQELLVTRQVNRAYNSNNIDDSNPNNIISDSFNSFGTNNENNSSNNTFGSAENNNDNKNNGGNVKFESGDAHMNLGTPVINDPKSVDSKTKGTTKPRKPRRKKKEVKKESSFTDNIPSPMQMPGSVGSVGRASSCSSISTPNYNNNNTPNYNNNTPGYNTTPNFNPHTPTYNNTPNPSTPVYNNNSMSGNFNNNNETSTNAHPSNHPLNNISNQKNKSFQPNSFFNSSDTPQHTSRPPSITSLPTSGPPSNLSGHHEHRASSVGCIRLNSPVVMTEPSMTAPKYNNMSQPTTPQKSANTIQYLPSNHQNFNNPDRKVCRGMMGVEYLRAEDRMRLVDPQQVEMSVKGLNSLVESPEYCRDPQSFQHLMTSTPGDYGHMEMEEKLMRQEPRMMYGGKMERMIRAGGNIGVMVEDEGMRGRMDEGRGRMMEFAGKEMMYRQEMMMRAQRPSYQMVPIKQPPHFQSQHFQPQHFPHQQHSIQGFIPQQQFSQQMIMRTQGHPQLPPHPSFQQHQPRMLSNTYGDVYSRSATEFVNLPTSMLPSKAPPTHLYSMLQSGRVPQTPM